MTQKGTEIFHIKMTSDVVVTDLEELSRWVLGQIAGLEDFYLWEGWKDPEEDEEQDEGEDVIMSDSECVYHLSSAWDMLFLATNVILAERTIPGVEVRNSEWDLASSQES
jgi:hypothetical protein